MRKARYVVQWNEHAVQQANTLCQFLKSETLVDLTIHCHSQTMKVHKCILAAHSIYFQERFSKDKTIEELVINGIKYTILRSLVEYIYCGETSVPQEYMEELISAAKYFGIRGLVTLVPQNLSGDNPQGVSVCSLINQPPLFRSKKKIVSKVRSTPSCTIVSDKTRAALAKEEALAIQRSDINNKSSMFIIDETCPDAILETNLLPEYQTSNNVIQGQEYIIENSINHGAPELTTFNINNLLPIPQQPSTDKVKYLMTLNNNQGNYIDLTANDTTSPRVVPVTNTNTVDYLDIFDQSYAQINTTKRNSLFENNKAMTFSQIVAETCDDTTYDEYPKFDALDSNQIILTGKGSSVPISLAKEVVPPNNGGNIGTSVLKKQDINNYKYIISPHTRKRKTDSTKSYVTKTIATKRRTVKDNVNPVQIHNTELAVQNKDTVNTIEDKVKDKNAKKSLPNYKDIYKIIFGESP